MAEAIVKETGEAPGITEKEAIIVKAWNLHVAGKKPKKEELEPTYSYSYKGGEKGSWATSRAAAARLAKLTVDQMDGFTRKCIDWPTMGGIDVGSSDKLDREDAMVAAPAPKEVIEVEKAKLEIAIEKEKKEGRDEQVKKLLKNREDLKGKDITKPPVTVTPPAPTPSDNGGGPSLVDRLKEKAKGAFTLLKEPRGKRKAPVPVSEPIKKD
jgi:hypothetical protein